jgi:hypothetical protein
MKHLVRSLTFAAFACPEDFLRSPQDHDCLIVDMRSAVVLRTSPADDFYHGTSEQSIGKHAAVTSTLAFPENPFGPW